MHKPQQTWAKRVLLDKVQTSSAEEAALHVGKHVHRTDQKNTMEK